MGLDRFIDNGQFLSMGNFTVKIVKVVHGQFLIFIQTYGERRENQGVLGGVIFVELFICENCSWTIVNLIEIIFAVSYCI